MGAVGRPFSSFLLLFVEQSKHTNLLGALLGLLGFAVRWEKHKTISEVQGGVRGRCHSHRSAGLYSWLPWPSPSPVPSLTYWELCKGAFPRSSCFAPALGTLWLGSVRSRRCSGKRSCPGCKVHLWVQATLAASARNADPQNAELLSFSSSFSWDFFLLILLLLCFVILGDVSSVFKPLLCCPSHFCFNFSLCSFHPPGSAVLSCCTHILRQLWQPQLLFCLFLVNLALDCGI